MSEVNSILWPNPEFDNDITVWGPEVKNLVNRYLRQMMAELVELPGPDGTGRLLDGIDLVVPHQANKTMVIKSAGAVGDYSVFLMDPAIVALGTQAPAAKASAAPAQKAAPLRRT